MTEISENQENASAIAEALAVLKKDYSKLPVRIRTFEHNVTSSCPRTTIRVHYPTLRDRKATVEDLIRLLCRYLMNFTLPQRNLDEIRAKYGNIPDDEYNTIIIRSFEEAKNLFIKANKATNRNGESGELLLYLLTEWILGAPQLLAKMPLKTNSNTPVYGSDGIHVKFSDETGKLTFLWGESKMHKDVFKAIDSAAASISDALSDKKLNFEFNLISRNIDLAGLSESAKNAILTYLDPNDEHSNERINVTTCLIGFDFDAYSKISKMKDEEVENAFTKGVLEKLPSLAGKLSKAMADHNLTEERVEVFFFPVPSVQDLRDLFQAEIGWSQ